MTPTLSGRPRRIDRPALSARRWAWLWAHGLVLAVVALSPAPASAAHKVTGPPKSVAETPQARAVAAQVRQALDEDRLVDAGTALDQATILGVKSPALATLKGELLLARGQFAQALDAFHAAPTTPAQAALNREGEGIALSQLGRSDEALDALKDATKLDASLWRAWNALGREYDLRRNWLGARAAYEAALSSPGVKTAMVLNNRGYSLLLQNRTQEAEADFLSALAKDPGLAAARTNLRIALAWQGAFDRATTTGAGDDRAAVLNNVGVAAAIHGDYAQAEKYLNAAIVARGQYYARASENLQMTEGLAGPRATTPTATDAPH
jgi:Flp pilus assembly protein TadD